MQFIDIFNIIVIASLSILFSIAIIGAISLFDFNKGSNKSKRRTDKMKKKKKGKKFVLIDKSVTVNIIWRGRRKVLSESKESPHLEM